MADVVSIDNFIRTKAEEVLCVVKARNRKIADVVEELLPHAIAETKLRIVNECTRLYLDSLQRKTK